MKISLKSEYSSNKKNTLEKELYLETHSISQEIQKIMSKVSDLPEPKKLVTDLITKFDQTTKTWFSFKSKLNNEHFLSRPKPIRLMKKTTNGRAVSEKLLNKIPIFNKKILSGYRKNNPKPVLKPSEFLKKTSSKLTKKYSIKTNQNSEPHIFYPRTTTNLEQNPSKIPSKPPKYFTEDLTILNSHHSYHTSNASIEFEKCMAEIDKLKQQSKNSTANMLEKSSSGWKSELESDEEAPTSFKEISSAISILEKANLLAPINLNLLENLFQLVSDPKKEHYARSYLNSLAPRPGFLAFNKKNLTNEFESTGPNSGDYSAVSFEFSNLQN